MRKLLTFALLMFAVSAIAQTPRTATITFEKPTQYVDGSTIPATVALSYRVYQGAKGGTKTLVGTITQTQTTINSGLQPGETCWQVSTFANGVESELSNEVCKLFPQPATEPVVITVV